MNQYTRHHFLLSIIALVLSTSVAHAWQFPQRPMHDSECRPYNWMSTDEGSAYLEKRKTGYQQLDYGKSCDNSYKAPSNQWVACYNEGAKRKDHFLKQMDDYRHQSEARYNQAKKQCEQVAQQNAQIEKNRQEQEKHAQVNAENNRRNQIAAQAENERQQRLQEQQRNQDRVRQEYAEQQKKQYAAQLESQRRQQEREQARQPRIINPTDSGYNAANRNDPRIVQTPQMQAQAKTEAAAAQEQQKIDQARVLRDTVTQLANAVVGTRAMDGSGVESNPVAKAGVKRLNNSADTARRDMFDAAVNPEGIKAPGLDRAVEAAQKENKAISTLRGTTPVATQMSNDALAATGTVINRNTGNLDSALKQIDSLGSIAPASRPAQVAPSGVGRTVQSVPSGAAAQEGNRATAASGANRAASSLDALNERSANAPPQGNAATPQVVASLDQLDGPARVTSPEQVCSSVEITRQKECMVAQCKLTKFATHRLCKKEAL